MDLREGYRVTEVGLIPKDWEAKQLSGNIEIIHGYGFESQYFRPYGSYLLTTPGHFFETGGFRDIREKQKYYDGPIPEGYLLNAGDLIIAMTEQADGLLGSAALIPSGRRYLHNQRLGKVRILSSNICLHYVYRLFNSAAFRSKVRETAAGTKVKHTSPLKLLEIAVPLPSTRVEQEVIATALSDVDALISSLETLITKKHQVKQGVMQQLLCPKEEWIEKRLGRCATLKARIGWQGLTTSEYLNSGDFHLVTGTDFKGGFIDWRNCHYVEENRYRQDKNIQLKTDDVLVTKDGTIGKVALVGNLDKPATLNSGVFVIRPIDEAFYPKFFYYLLCSSVFSDFLGQLSAGSTINHLYQKDFVNFIFKTPETLEEQREIATTLFDMDAEIAALENKLAKTRQLKQGMMAELLTGRIRLV
jgi:type I restriction enzyme, S subunit